MPRPCAAYVLPAEFLSRLIADGRRPSLRDAALTVAVTKGTPDAPSPPGEAASNQPSEARWYFKRPDQLRIEQLGPDGKQEVEIIRGGVSYQGDEQSQAARGPSQNLLPLLLFPGGKDLDEASAQVLAGLAGAGIDPNATALARWQQGFAYVIGGEAAALKGPQLWLDKATFEPRRLLWPLPAGAPPGPVPSPMPATPATPATPPGGPAAGSSPLPPGPANARELRLMNYVAGLPRAWEEWERGELRYRAEVIHLLVNQRLEDSLFAPAQAAASRLPAAR